MTLPLVEAVLEGRLQDVQDLVQASLPEVWPGRALLERAFRASLDEVRLDPARRLWGDRLLITHGPGRRLLGSVVFRGAPDADGRVELAYGVEREAQGQGYASEGVSACVAWALAQPGVKAVGATTPPWHFASRKVLERAGLCVVGVREHELLGELLEYEARTEPPCREELTPHTPAVGLLVRQGRVTWP